MSSDLKKMNLKSKIEREIVSDFANFVEEKLGDDDSMDGWEDVLSKSIKKHLNKFDVVKSKKGKKDPDAPKRPMTAFMYYTKENRSIVKEEDESLGFADIARELGSRWKNLDEEEKEPYLEMAAEDKERYQREMEDYKGEKDSEDSDEENPAKKGRKKQSPKTAAKNSKKKKEESDEEKPLSKKKKQTRK